MIKSKFRLSISRCWVLLGAIFIVMGNCFSQAIDSSTFRDDDKYTAITHESPERLVLLSTATAFTLFELHRSYVNAWWWKDRRSFHILYDGRYACNIDKLGHAVAWNIVAEGYHAAYRWAGWDDKSARWWAFGTAAGLHLFTESHEGLASQFGFDPFDYLSGMMGAGLVVGQYYWPWARRIHMRGSFIPSRSYNDRHTPFRDYEGQKYWIGVTLLPEENTSFLRGLTVDAGFNLNDYDATVARVYPQLWISIGVDWKRYIGDNVAAQFLNYLKFPFPALRVSPRPGVSLTSWD